MLNVLFSVVLLAVEELVEQRDIYVNSQHRIEEAGFEIDTLKEQVAQLELMVR